MTKPAYPIESVDNALRLLLLLRERQVIRVAQASDSLGIARSTAHRLLAMLQHYDFVRREPDTRAYVAGPALFDAGMQAVRETQLRDVARPVLARLSRRIRETAHCVVMHAGTRVLFLDSVESGRTLRTGSRVGVSLPAHCTSAGKAMLAELPIEAVNELYADAALTRLTPRTLSEIGALEEELARVRRRGYATNLGESEADVAAVGMAVRGGGDTPLAALAVSAPVSRLPRGMRISAAKELRRATAELARATRAMSSRELVAHGG